MFLSLSMGQSMNYALKPWEIFQPYDTKSISEIPWIIELVAG